jgi:predicted Zn-dependent peptidase
MTRLAKNEIYFNNYLPVETILRGIDEVDESMVQDLARNLLDERFFCLTILGPVDENGLEKKFLQWGQ